MAKANYCDGAPVCNPLSTNSTIHALHPEIVIAPTITPELQVKLLALVDETESISLGDCMAALPDTNAVDAVLAMIEHGLLAFDMTAPFDQHLQIRRATKGWGDTNPSQPSSESNVAEPASAADDEGALSPHEIPLRSLTPQIFALSGTDRRQIAGIEALSRPGIYLLTWYDGAQPQVYVGYGKNVRSRLSSGGHMDRPIVPDLVIGIVERHNQLTESEARVLERLVHQAMIHARDVDVVNGVPDGDTVEPAAYVLLRQLTVQIILALRDHGILCLSGTARHHAAGPRAGRGQLAALRAGLPPSGKLYELSAVGIKSYAAEQDGRWTVLAGSEVRRKTVASANSPASFLRAEYLYSGILVEDGVNLRLTRDLMFESGSGAAHFVTGAKGHGLAAWQEVDEIPDAVTAPFAGRRLGPAS